MGTGSGFGRQSTCSSISLNGFADLRCWCFASKPQYGHHSYIRHGGNDHAIAYLRRNTDIVDAEALFETRFGMNTAGTSIASGPFDRRPAPAPTRRGSKRAQDAFRSDRFAVLYRAWLQDGERALTVGSSCGISEALSVVMTRC